MASESGDSHPAATSSSSPSLGAAGGAVASEAALGSVHKLDAKFLACVADSTLTAIIGARGRFTTAPHAFHAAMSGRTHLHGYKFLHVVKGSDGVVRSEMLPRVMAYIKNLLAAYTTRGVKGAREFGFEVDHALGTVTSE